MASRARKIRRHNERLNADGFLLPSPFLAFLLVLVVLGVAQVTIQNSEENIRTKIVKTEQAIDELEKQISAAEYAWNSMVAPGALRAALQKHGLAMSVPAPSRVVMIHDIDEWLARGRKRDVPFLQVADVRGIHIQ